MFSIDSFTSSFMAISLSDILFTSKKLSISSTLTNIPIPFFLPSAPSYNSLPPTAMFLALLPFHFVSSRHSTSIFLCSIKSASSLPFPVIAPTFEVPMLITVHLSFRSSRCLFTRLHSLFLFLFFLSPVVLYCNFHKCLAVRHLSRLLVTCTSTDPVWNNFSFTFLMIWQKVSRRMLYCHNTPHLSGLEAGSENTEKSPRWLG